MADRLAEQRAWVARVLGITVSDESVDPLQVRERLQAVGQALRSLKAEGAPEVQGLVAALAAAAASPAPPDVAALLDKLESDLARALSAARGREAKRSNPRSIDTTKLLLRWRDAQKRVETSLSGLGQSILARADVKADPRFSAVEQAVGRLPRLVPEFGGQLETLLDRAMNQGSMDGIAPDALAAIGDYRKTLSGASVLLQLEMFAQRHVGAVALHGELDRALGELEQTIGAGA